jgi:hypothetical protein
MGILIINLILFFSLCMYKVVSQRTFVRFRELLNEVWGLEGCPLKGQTMRKHR